MNLQSQFIAPEDLIPKLRKIADDNPLPKGDTYLLTYSILRDAIEPLEFDTTDDLYLSAMLIYGWMPTIPALNSEKADTARHAIHSLKAAPPKIPDTQSLNAIKEFLNNSVVGTSKLLHFIKPELYPIWDSRIQLAIGGSNYQYIMQNPEKYRDYCLWIHELKNREELKQSISHITDNIRNTYGCKISPIRAVEYLIFSYSKEAAM